MDDRHKRRRSHEGLVDLVGKRDEVARPILDPLTAKLDFHKSPAPIWHDDNRIGLTSRRVVAVMRRSAYRLAVHAQVAHDERLE